MNRRDVMRNMRNLVLAVSSTILPDVSAEAKSIAKPLTYRDWQLIWTGWKPIANQDAMAGQWIAYDRTGGGWGLYSSYPGSYGPFVPGSVFDLSLRRWQQLPTRLTPPDVLVRMNSECLAVLKLMVDIVGPPPVSFPLPDGKTDRLLALVEAM